MKLRAAIAVFLSVGLCPALALCAEAGEGSGAWLNLLFFVLNFAAFVFIVVYFAAPLVSKFFRDRSTDLRETLRRLEADARHAQELADQAAARQSRLEADKAALADEMRAETAREIAHMRELARAATERIKRDAELTAAASVESARRQMRAHLAQIAATLARGLIVNNLDAADQSRLIEDFMDQLHREEAKP